MIRERREHQRQLEVFSEAGAQRDNSGPGRLGRRKTQGIEEHVYAYHIILHQISYRISYLFSHISYIIYNTSHIMYHIPYSYTTYLYMYIIYHIIYFMYICTRTTCIHMYAYAFYIYTAFTSSILHMHICTSIFLNSVDTQVKIKTHVPATLRTQGAQRLRSRFLHSCGSLGCGCRLSWALQRVLASTRAMGRCLRCCWMLTDASQQLASKAQTTYRTAPKTSLA